MHPAGVLRSRSTAVCFGGRFRLNRDSGLAAHRRIKALLDPDGCRTGDCTFSALLRNFRLAGIRAGRSNGVVTRAAFPDWHVDSASLRHCATIYLRTAINTHAPVLRAELLVTPQFRPDLFRAERAVQLPGLLGLVFHDWSDCSSRTLELAQIGERLFIGATRSRRTCAADRRISTDSRAPVAAGIRRSRGQSQPVQEWPSDTCCRRSLVLPWRWDF